LKDIFERSGISFNPFFAEASSFAKAEFILSFVEGEDTSEGRRVFTAEHSRSIRTSAEIKLKILDIF
jgi:hypothetical protein